MIMFGMNGRFLVKGCDVAMIMGLMLGAYMYMRFYQYMDIQMLRFDDNEGFE